MLSLLFLYPWTENSGLHDDYVGAFHTCEMSLSVFWPSTRAWGSWRSPEWAASSWAESTTTESICAGKRHDCCVVKCGLLSKRPGLWGKGAKNMLAGHYLQLKLQETRHLPPAEQKNRSIDILEVQIFFFLNTPNELKVKKDLVQNTVVQSYQQIPYYKSRLGYSTINGWKCGSIFS